MTPSSTGGFAQVCGAPLYYEVSGSGRPLVLLHEGIADHRMYDDQVVAFAANYQVIRYDLHGFGHSGVPAEPYTNHDALRDLLRQLGIERASLLGMSLGGSVALDFALAHPAMVDALVLAAAGLGGYNGSPSTKEATERQWAAIGAALKQGDQPRAVELTVRMWLDGPRRTPEQVDPRVRERISAIVAEWCAWSRGRAQPLEPPAIDRLQEIAVPTLVLVGDGDQPDVLAIADLLAQGIRGARKVALPGVAHLPNVEQPGQFNRLVLDFLADAPGQALPAGWSVLAREDFADFPVGPFPYDYSPQAEYHDIQPAGYRGRWREATLVSGWRDAASWNVVDDQGRPALEQSCVRQGHLPMVETGAFAWSNYRLTALVRPLFTKPAKGTPVVAPMARTPQGVVGLVARYTDSRDYYALVLTSDDTVELRRASHDGTSVLASARLVVDQDRTYCLSLEVVGDQLTGLVDGAAVVNATDSTFNAGKVALVANVPARFRDVMVAAPTAAVQTFRQRLSEQERLLLTERERYPQPVLARTIATPGFGTSKHLRFADLDGDGRQEIVLAQALDRGPRDVYRMLTCLTVLDLDGRVRWQFGRPTAFRGMPTSDLCFQVYDLDQDGRPEVMLTKDFQLLVLDGRTGHVKQAVPTPPAPPPENMFYRTIGDSLAIANLRGRAAPQDILLKDRYHNVWAYDDKLGLLWTAQGITTGHFPALYDLDGDGRDEIVMGYSCLDHDGRPMWHLGIDDHADGIAVGTFRRDHPDEIEIRLAASDEGLLWVSADGEILARDRTGHVQRFSIANLRPEQPGLEMVTITFWGEPGIMCFYDGERRRYASLERNHQASPLHPTNWTGDGQELIFYSGNSREGGLLDGWGRQVVVLPDDGHPSRCHQAVDLLGDGRDELVVWDYDRLYIYTQDRPAPAGRRYRPRRLQPYNVSNYRAEVSLPGWEDEEP